MSNKKTKVVLALTTLAMSVALSACGHEHEWKEATCTTPKTCVTCEETEGEALGHEWEEANCTTAKRCSVCGETEGEALGHKWEEATCTTAKVCNTCGETEGEALGHEWKEATCTEPQTCLTCKITEGTKLEHDLNSTGKCKNCKKQVGIELTWSNYKDYFTFTGKFGDGKYSKDISILLKDPSKYEVGYGYYKATYKYYSPHSTGKVEKTETITEYFGKDGVEFTHVAPYYQYDIRVSEYDVVGYLLEK